VSVMFCECLVVVGLAVVECVAGGSGGVPTAWMTSEEAAAYLKTKTRTLLKWVREGAIKGWPLHGIKRRTWRFRRADLDAAALGFVTAPIPAVVLESAPSSVVRSQ